MNFWELLLTGLGLSMDAAAVTITDMLSYPKLSRRRRLAIPAAFALFQALMPMAGYFAGSLFQEALSRYAGPMTLAILGVIGLNMIREGFAVPELPAPVPDPAPQQKEPAAVKSTAAGSPAAERTGRAESFPFPARQLTAPVLFAQALATSIDALAVGVSFAAGGSNIFLAAPVIGLTTFCCSLAALRLGSRFGALLGRRAQFFGGLILILLGIKALF